ncbi:MAG: UDP-4-amino-4,6-dideoxy-N-acetyl-beta-L-altrosamine transaminase [Candidatus Thermoplasmatota archaeon]|nr:UDP-4-amino-4,6-dideoxy-N-acetyl-beta-L-altrosamine transaminase [Candidatus Thermoplasmatota archaeon]
MDELAINGGPPVREEMLPYGSQTIDQEDIEAAVEVLRSDWLTTGPTVDDFEQAVADYVGARHGVAVSNGTAALHTAMRIAGISQGDEVIVPTLTFAASANAALFEGAVPVFADVDPGTLLLDPEDVAERITARTEAILPVDFAGQPCDYRALRDLADDHDLALIADGCHALGADQDGRKVGSLAYATCFRFHPVKHITTGEGGMVTTDEASWAEHGRRFRHPGMVRGQGGPIDDGPWAYKIPELGQNYRLTDLQCALGLTQLAKLDGWVERRRQIAARYDEAFQALPGIEPLATRRGAFHAYHLYVVRIDEQHLGMDRRQVFEALRAEGIGVNVHYIPVHLQPFYRETLGTKGGMCPNAEEAYQEILSLPMFPTMTSMDTEDVLAAMQKITGEEMQGGSR